MSSLPPPEEEKPNSTWRAQLHEIIFEADTSAGKAFDLTLQSSLS